LSSIIFNCGGEDWKAAPAQANYRVSTGYHGAQLYL